MSRLVSVEGESADKSLHECHASAGVPIAVQWRRPEAQTCWHRIQSQTPCRHMVQRKLKSRASCPMEETRDTDL